MICLTDSIVTPPLTEIRSLLTMYSALVTVISPLAVMPVASISTASRTASPAKSPMTPLKSALVAVMVAVPSPVVVMVVLTMSIPSLVVSVRSRPAVNLESMIAVVMAVTSMSSVAVMR